MNPRKDRRIYIVGAGFSGKEIAREIKSKGTFGTVVSFLDDDPGKIGTTIDGVPVCGPIDSAAECLKRVPADEAIIAIPEIDREGLRRIHASLQNVGFRKIRFLPRISQILDESPHVIQARDINPEDFLGRDPVTIPLRESLSYLRGKRVLITGASGSIGSELSRQLLSGGAQRLYLFDHEENSLYETEKELRILQAAGVGEAATIVPIVGELKDRDFTRFIIGRLNADVIFHCAAYKHVPMMEMNPVEAIKNNVFGTKHLVDAAVDHRVSRFVLISTDKAVDPVCVYGASKMLAEEIVLHAASSGLDFMVVRFGNVLDSRGSIVPLFRKQIFSGGPVTVTDPKASRFFMTLPESASLVLKAGGVGERGTLYILDMGDPVNITDLAEQMIRFYGFEPGKEIKIVYTGLRPGEKLTETLWSADERPVKTSHPRISRLERKARFNGELIRVMEKLYPICYFREDAPDRFRNRRVLRETLHELIPTIKISEHEPEY